MRFLYISLLVSILFFSVVKLDLTSEDSSQNRILQQFGASNQWLNNKAQPPYPGQTKSLLNLTQIFGGFASPVSTIVNTTAKLTLNTTSVVENDKILVTLSGVEKPAIDDMIALYTPNATVTILNKIPQKFKAAISDTGYLQSGNGTYIFNVINNLDDFVIALVRNASGRTNLTCSALSPSVAQTDKFAPTQGHLGYNGNYTEMVVQWTQRGTSRPSVMYGTAPGQLTMKLTNITFLTYNPDDVCYFPANSTGYIYPGVFLRGFLKNLLPLTRYYYKYGDEQFGFSQEYTFRTLPVTGPQSNLTMFALADQGEADSDMSYNLLNYIASLNVTRGYTNDNKNKEYQYMLINGDITYARGYVGSWNIFFKQMQEVLTAMPLAVTFGNHERKSPGSGDFWDSGNDSGGECGVATERRIFNPFQKGTTQFNTQYWYSYNVGPVHFIALCSELNFTIGSDQWNFAFNDLSKVNRTLTPWVIVNIHRPMYISSNQYSNSDSHQNVANLEQLAFSDLFYFFQVDFTWHGHYHAYMRTCPVYERVCKGYNADGTANAPITVTFGNAGAQLYQIIQDPQPAYFDKVIVEFGYTRVFINSTFYRMTAIRALDGSVMDDYVVRKRPDFGPQYMAKYNNFP